MKPVRVALVDPINHQDKVETYFPPLGLGYLSAYLKQHCHAECLISSGNLPELLSWKPDIVGITSVSQYFNQAKAIAQLIHNAHIPVIMGGAHISALPHLTNSMDAAVIGEGEETLSELVRFFELNHNLRAISSIPGIAYHGGATQSRKLLDLDTLPFPDRLFTHQHTSMFTSRGCPYSCCYCFSTRFWNKTRFFSADYVVSEIEYLHSQGVIKISLLDDLFIADKKRMAHIIDLLGKKDLLGKISYICNVRSNLVTDDLCQMLKILNVEAVGWGIESACPKTLAYLKDHITVQQHSQALQLLRKYKIHPHPSFIIGCPDETADDISETLQFISRNHLSTYEAYVLIPFPGTPVWEEAKFRNLVSDNLDWNRLHWDFDNTPNPVILSKHLTHEQLLKIHRDMIKRKDHLQVKNLISHVYHHPSSPFSYLKKRLLTSTINHGIP
jgi:anaerobic magnesium-protoporphyrin IX monomethyl ester cyclase